MNWPRTQAECEALPALSELDFLMEPMTAVAPGGDDMVAFADKAGSWRVEHTDKHGFVKVPLHL